MQHSVYLVTWVSMNIKMKNKPAGMTASGMAQTCRFLSFPRGFISHFLLSASVGAKPSGTSSFWIKPRSVSTHIVWSWPNEKWFSSGGVVAPSFKWFLDPTSVYVSFMMISNTTIMAMAIGIAKSPISRLAWNKAMNWSQSFGHMSQAICCAYLLRGLVRYGVFFLGCGN